MFFFLNDFVIYKYSRNLTQFLGYSPLGSFGTASLFKGGDVLQNPILKAIADKLGKTPAQVALRWGLQKGHSMLPKSTSESRIKENFDIFDWSIPEDLFAKFSEFHQVSNHSSIDLVCFLGFKYIVCGRLVQFSMIQFCEG
ncbi:hypothetical protein IC575_002878 [Cucumis melo]